MSVKHFNSSCEHRSLCMVLLMVIFSGVALPMSLSIVLSYLIVRNRLCCNACLRFCYAGSVQVGYSGRGHRACTSLGC